MRLAMLVAIVCVVLMGAAGAACVQMDPVILTGAGVPSVVGLAPEELVAYRYDDGWVQIPLQVDERAVINFTTVYNGRTTYGSFARLDYVDPGTYTGPDPDPAIDADDEIVFMAVDAGEHPAVPGTVPEHVANPACIEVQIHDPSSGSYRYAYLFRQDGTLDPGAGARYVTYLFDLLSGDYKTTYKISAGPNPEDSTIATDCYERHFIDRWKSDVLRIFVGDATGADILDRHKNLFYPGVCGRSENTFCAGEGAFVINKEGPVRAIRGYVGANSGPRTQRQNIFYRQREDITTHLRVHSLAMGIMDFFDYSAQATGMTYYNDNVPGGVLCDGVNDAVPEARPRWEAMRGPQGVLAMRHIYASTIPDLTVVAYYLDDAAPDVVQCTGDGAAYASSGNWVFQPLPNTDPNKGVHEELSVARSIYYLGPETTIGEIQGLMEDAEQPLVVTTRAWNADVRLPLRAPLGILLLLAVPGYMFSRWFGIRRAR